MDQQHEWAEDDFDLPAGVSRLGLSEPVSGRKYVMYHGTSRKNVQSIQATGFHQSAGGMLGRGVYLSRDLQKASRYPIGHPEYDRVVIKVMVDVGKVIAIRKQNHPLQKTWHDSGYDTAWVPPKCGMVRSGLEEDCVWDPNRIKIISTINPQPIQSPRPVQSFSSLGACGYSDSGIDLNQSDTDKKTAKTRATTKKKEEQNDSGISVSQPVTGKKTATSRGAAKKKEEQNDSGISVSQPVTGKKTATSRGATKKKEEQNDSGISVSQPVTGKKTATSRGTTKKKEEQNDSGISVSQPVTGKKTSTSRGAAKKKEEQNDLANNMSQLSLWAESNNDPFDRMLRFPEPVADKKPAKTRTRKK